MKKGISLITLVITIIVIIILALAIILSLKDTNIIDSANEAVIRNDINSLQSELEMYALDKYLSEKGKYDLSKLDANSDRVTYDEKIIEGITIYDVISSLNEISYKEDIIIEDGEIIYIGDNPTIEGVLPGGQVVKNTTNPEIIIQNLFPDSLFEFDEDVIITIDITDDEEITSVDLTNKLKLYNESNEVVYTDSDSEIVISEVTGDSKNKQVTITLSANSISLNGIYTLVVEKGIAKNKYNKYDMFDKDIDFYMGDNPPTPLVPQIYLSTEEYTNQDILANIVYSEDSVTKQYRYDINDPWIDYIEPITITENKIIFAQGINSLGVSNESLRDVTNIDKELPDGVLSPNSSGEEVTSRIVSFNPSDNGSSGVDRWRYRISTNNGSSYDDWKLYITGDITSDIILDQEGTNKIQIEVEDKAGNNKTITSGSYEISETRIVYENGFFVEKDEGGTTGKIIKYMPVNYNSNLVIPEYVKGVYVNRIEDESFTNCYLSSITISGNIKSIGDNQKIKSYNFILEEGVESIGDNLFDYYRDASVSLPSTLKSISPDAFNEAEFTSISIDSNNPNFCIEDDILFTKDKTRLIKSLNDNRNYVIPNTVQRIENYAFYECRSRYELTIPNSVTSIGKYACYGNNRLNYINIPGSVKTIEESAFDGCDGEITLEEGIESIEKGAFHCSHDNCDLYVNIPDSVKYIGSYAFSVGDSNYRSLYIKSTNNIERVGGGALTGKVTVRTSDGSDLMQILNNVKILEDEALRGYGSWGSVSLPNGVTHIGGHLFNNFNMDKVTIPASVESIDDDAFFYRAGNGDENCISEFDVDNNNQYYSDYLGALFNKNRTRLINSSHDFWDSCYSLYGSSFTIPGYIKILNEGVFRNALCCNRLVISNGVERIGKDAFKFCEDFTRITIAGSVKVIEDSAFGSTADISELILNEGLEIIGNGAFPRDTTINIPSTVKSIGIPSRSYFIVDENNPYYSSKDGALYNKDKTKLISVPYYGIDEIPDSVTHIGDYAFSGCHRYSPKVTIPSSVTHIGKKAFSGRQVNITSANNMEYIGEGAFSYASIYDIYPDFVLPNTLEIIEDEAFKSCDSIRNLTIPNSVKTIGDEAFESCDNLANLTIPNSIIRIGDKAFYYCNNLTNINNGETLVLNDIEYLGSNVLPDFVNFKITNNALNKLSNESISKAPWGIDYANLEIEN